MSAHSGNRQELVCSYFVIYFGLFFCNIYESERIGKTIYGESVESVSFFMAFILSSQYTFSPQIITVIKASIYYKVCLTT